MKKYSLLGLDIGSKIIKLVQLERRNNNFFLKGYGTVPTPPKGFASEAISDLQALSQTIRDLCGECRVSTQEVVSALPESSVFTRVISLPFLSDKELASAIHWEAEQYIPVPLEEVNLVWDVLEKDRRKNKMQILLVAAPKNLARKYAQVLKDAGLKPVALETELIALARSLVGEASTSPTSLVISIGAKTTDICIVNKGKIALTRSISTAGEALTRSLATTLNFDPVKAEEYKKSYGLKGEMEGKIKDALKPVFDLIVNEVKRALAFYQEENPGEQIKRVVLAGGSAKLPGAVIYLAEALGVETQIGNPWERIEMTEAEQNELLEQGPEYAVAVGLAEREK